MSPYSTSSFSTVARHHTSLLFLLGAVSAVGFSACSPPSDVAELTQSLSGMAITVYDEGSCEYLKSCSGPSQPPYIGINWACKSFRTDWQGGACSNSDRWIAVPSSYKDDLCATKVQICRSGTCTLADVKDISNATVWEASPQVMADLSLSRSDGHGTYPHCTSGTGLGAVTISSGTWSTLSRLTVPAGTTQTIYFSPSKVGNHVIEYTVAASQGGKMAFVPYWSSSAYPGWHLWTADDASVTSKRLPLSSGSVDVHYKFDVKNSNTSSKDLYYRTLVGL